MGRGAPPAAPSVRLSPEGRDLTDAASTPLARGHVSPGATRGAQDTPQIASPLVSNDLHSTACSTQGRSETRAALRRTSRGRQHRGGVCRWSSLGVALDGVVLERAHAGLRVVLHGHLQGLLLALGDLELANVLDPLVVLDAPATVRPVARDRVPECLVQLLSAHLVRVDGAVLALVELAAVVAVRHLEAEEAVVVGRHGASTAVLFALP
mmetsp:Transcript_21470/g.54923  ORF Transcript_21470/g.54923 Transcript_21470/m.54923 type:complete len:210 (+) Transcript_21470:187-816(+)